MITGTGAASGACQERNSGRKALRRHRVMVGVVLIREGWYECGDKEVGGGRVID